MCAIVKRLIRDYERVQLGPGPPGSAEIVHYVQRPDRLRLDSPVPRWLIVVMAMNAIQIPFDIYWLLIVLT